MTKKTITTVIPAQPGYLEAIYLDDDHGSFDYQPIVAWAVCVELDEDGEFQSGQAYPVTPDSPSSNLKMIKYPDGRFVDPWAGQYANVDEAIQALKDNLGG